MSNSRVSLDHHDRSLCPSTSVDRNLPAQLSEEFCVEEKRDENFDAKMTFQGDEVK